MSWMGNSSPVVQDKGVQVTSSEQSVATIMEKESLIIDFNEQHNNYGSLNQSNLNNEGTPKRRKDIPGTHGSPEAFKRRNVAKRTSVIYCVHGNVDEKCCEVEKAVIDLKHNATTHCHVTRSNVVDKQAKRKLIIASILCVIFMIVEIIGGLWSNSLAIATDAAHLMADLAAFMISLFALWVAQRPSTRRLSFGYHRAEVIGALVSVLTIWVVTAILVYLAILRVIHQDFELKSDVMLVTSAFGILVNIIMGCTLHSHGHSHGGSSAGHSHNGETSSHSHNNGIANTGSIIPEQENMNVRAALIHVISDFMQSLGVFIAALVMYFKPEWNVIDPICTFLFSILVLLTTIAIMKDALLVLMEGVPKFLDYTEVMQTFMSIPGVVRVHNLRIWALSINKIALAAHLAVEPNVNTESILKEATKEVHKKFQFYETFIQIEDFIQEMEDCHQCVNPDE